MEASCRPLELVEWLTPIPSSLHRWRRVLDNGERGGVPLAQRMPGCGYLSHPLHQYPPIRRLTLQPGSAATLSMVYIAVPQMHVEVTEQRYTCLKVTSSGGRYHYESLVNGVSQFTVELPVDRDGLVLDYPGLFRRVGTW